MSDVARSTNGVLIRLTNERWMHILRGHPEMASLRDEVLRTVSAPDQVQQGDVGELIAIRLPASLAPRYVVVVYRERDADDGFVITAYVTRQPSRSRKVLWTR